jgi:hypothetical protein
MTVAAPASERPRTDRDRGRGLPGAVTLALGRPSAWPIALAGFLVRGGILLFLLPVVVLPTPTELATAFGSDIIALALAAPTAAVARLAAAAILLVVGWLLVASIVGAAADAALAWWAAAPGAIDAGPGRAPEGSGPAAAATGEAAPAAPRRGIGLVLRVAIVRLACHLPLAIASVWAIARIVAAVYREYISPGDLSVPLPLRVAASVPDAIGLLIVAWLLGEALGGLAARGVALEGRSVGRAILGAVTSLVLHPVSAGIALVTTTVVVVLLVAPPIAASALIWDELRRELLGPADPGPVLAATLAFAALWLAGLAAAGVATTIRSSIWTWHALRVGEAGPRMAPVPRPVAGSSAAEA